MKFRYLLVEDAGNVTGTNDTKVAKEAAKDIGDNGFTAVIDAQEGKELYNELANDIPEQTVFKLGE